MSKKINIGQAIVASAKPALDQLYAKRTTRGYRTFASRACISRSVCNIRANSERTVRWRSRGRQAVQGFHRRGDQAGRR